MNEHAKRFHEEANRIAARLINQKWNDPENVVGDVREGLYIGDVQEEAWQFWGEVETLRRLGLPFPAIRAGNRNVPVALMNFWWLRAPRHPFYAKYLYDFVRDWERTPSDWRTVVEVDAAVESFKAGTVDFLATRIASVDEFFNRRSNRAGVSPVSLTLTRTRLWKIWVRTVGFTVDVHTSTSGLRVHVSPSFRLNWRYFGMPTTPVISTLTGGIYKFGADGGPYTTITPDPSFFDIPYQTVSPKLTL